MIPFFDAHSIHDPLNSRLVDSFKEVLERSHFVLGSEVASFEREFAEYCGASHCVTVGNGLDALVLALRGWGVGPGDEVIVPGQTFVATWLAVSAVGAKCVAVDVDLASVLIDVDKVAAAVTAKTKVVIAVHLFGQAVDIKRLRSVLPSHIKILEDAAQAHGAYSGAQRVGSLGDAAALTFYPTKNLGCLGDGGAVTTSDSDLAKSIAMLRNYGSETKYLHEVSGVNSRLDELQAAFLRVKLPHLDEWNASRRRAAEHYSNRLSGLQDLELPTFNQPEAHVFHLYVVKTKARDKLQKALQAKEISALIHYPIAPGVQPIYKQESVVMANSRLAAATSLSLPLWPNIPLETIDEVCDAVKETMSR